jgi:hypothetical protein
MGAERCDGWHDTDRLGHPTFKMIEFNQFRGGCSVLYRHMVERVFPE